MQDVRVLLLSATPYKMLTLYGENEHHYEDFLQTLQFLYDNERHVKQGTQASGCLSRRSCMSKIVMA